MPIYGKPYIDISNYVDLESFDKLNPEICRSFVLAKSNNLSFRGNLILDKQDQQNVNLDEYNGMIKPLWYRYEEFLNLPDTDPIKVSSADFSENELALYLKYAMGAYDPYQVFPLFSHTFTDKVKTKEMSGICKYVPNLIKWIDNIEIFSYIDRAYFLLLEPGGISVEHFDSSENPEVPREFIHIRSSVDRPFYVREHTNSKKIYIDARVAYFNDQDWHGGEPDIKSGYTLRIDGVFTDEFRKILCTNESK